MLLKQIKKLSGNPKRGKARRRKNRECNTTYDSLEPKQLLAAITPDYANRVIVIDGSNAVDTLLVTDVDSYTKIKIDFVADGVQFDPNVHTYLRSQFDTIRVNGLDGNDTLDNMSLVSGDIRGGEGDDILRGGWLNDELRGGQGNDFLNGRNGNDLLWGGNGNDTLDGGTGIDHINGNAGNDHFSFSPTPTVEQDYIYEAVGGGEDKISFVNLDATHSVTADLSITGVFASHTNRTIFSNLTANFENLDGSAGNDSLKGNNVSNKINGLNGNDTIWGLGANDIIWGGQGNDNINGGEGNDNLNGQSGNDNYYFISTSTQEYDWLYELPNGGNDVITFSQLSASDPVSVDLSVAGNLPIATHTNREVRTPGYAANFERAIGGAGDDTFIGHDTYNHFTGNAGDDRFEGKGGNDYMAGGSGNDVYVFDAASAVENDTVVEHANEGIDSLDFRSIPTTVTADLGSSTDIVSTHLNRNVRVQSAGYGVHLENAFGLTGEDIWSFRGDGQITAVIDSGIAYDHSALGGGFGPNFKVVGGFDFAENDADPYDDGPAGFHGTHVAGIVANTDAVETGVAPDSDLVALRVFDDNGGGNLADVRDALQWVLDNVDTFANPITTVNLSLGVKGNANAFVSNDLVTNQVNDLLEDIANEGIFISVSAGNDFQDPAFNNQPGLAFPAISPHVVPVASHENGANINTLSDFSQRRFNVLAAPGRSIQSTVPDHLFGGQQTNQFLGASGTSQAAPYVAGASILLREAFETVGVAPASITQEMLYSTFQNYAEVIADPITNANYDRINLEAALAGVLVDGFIPVAPQSSSVTVPPSAPQVATGSLVMYESLALNTANDSARTNFSASSTKLGSSVDVRESQDPDLLAESDRSDLAAAGVQSEDTKQESDAEPNRFGFDKLVSDELADFSFDFEMDFELV